MAVRAQRGQGRSQGAVRAGSPEWGQRWYGLYGEDACNQDRRSPFVCELRLWFGSGVLSETSVCYLTEKT